MHGSPGGQDQVHNPFGGMIPPGVNIQQLLMAANSNGGLQMQGDFERRQGMNA